MRDDRALLIDMVEHTREVRVGLASTSREAFNANSLLRMGVAHTLQVIGEAARSLSNDARQRYPQIQWNRVVGMRHLLVHEYFRIDFDLVWDTATVSVPEMLGSAGAGVRSDH
jgi:uncharacterized protein with HEPN domain